MVTSLFTDLLTVFYLAVAIWTVIYTILSIILMILFIKPIEKLIMLQARCRKDTSSTTETNRNNGDKTNETLFDSDFLFIVIKHGLLVSIAICSSFILPLTGTIMEWRLRVVEPEESAFECYHIITMFPAVLDGMISSGCTYLLCKMNKGMYKKLCWKIHSICEKYKVNKIMKGIDTGNDINMTKNQTSVDV